MPEKLNNHKYLKEFRKGLINNLSKKRNNKASPSLFSRG
jgi:hypothetical protein